VERLMAQRESHAARAEGPFVVTMRWPSQTHTGAYLSQPR